MVDRWTDILADNGVRPQDIVGTLAPNSANLALLSLAAWQVGATLWPLTPQGIVQAEYLCSAPERRVWFLIDHSDIQDSVHRFAKSQSLRSWIPGQPVGLYVARSGARTWNPSTHRSCLWISSSGTTGPRKTVALGAAGTLANLIANASSLNLRTADSTLVWLPMHYCYAMVGQFLSHLHAGSTIVFPDFGHLIHTLPAAISRHNVSTLFTVPSLLASLLRILEHDGLRETLNASLRLITIGGEPVDKSIVQRALTAFPMASIVITYGLAEAGPRVTTNYVRDDNFEHVSVGRPIPGVRLEVADMNGKTTEPFVEGEIVVVSPSVMIGYAFESDPIDFVPEKRIRTGDIGYLTLDGQLHLSRRRSPAVGEQAPKEKLDEYFRVASTNSKNAPMIREHVTLER